MTVDADKIAISARGICKDYFLYDSPHHFLMEFLTGRQRHKIFSALTDVSFEIAKGEVVGIIGRNGSGKTTLLRILAGTLDKTGGDATVNGRISAIMALGTGFNPELTGRENIYIGGLCLGMSPKEIRAKTDAIIAFSGLANFIDRPIRSYSSGMQARLAFSVAAAVDPDILIVDEALSTGDAAFSAKSYGRMREIADGGATVLLVSHNMQDIYNLCDRVIMLERGRVIGIGDPREIGRIYEDRVHAEIAAEHKQAAPVTNATSEEGIVPDAEIIKVELLKPDGHLVSEMETGEEYLVRLTTRFHKDIPSVSIGFNIQSATGSTVYGVSTSHIGQDITGKAGQDQIIILRIRCNLAPGTYSLMAVTAQNMDGIEHAYNYSILHKLYDALTFTITSNYTFSGMVDMNCHIAEITAPS